MKGMNRIKRGTGFRGALDYVFGRDAAHKEEPGELIGGNMSGTDVRQLAREFAAVRALRPDIGKPVWHNALRLPEGETLPPERWKTLCDEYMQRMGFTPDHPRCYVMLDDAQGQHIRILASRNRARKRGEKRRVLRSTSTARCRPAWSGSLLRPRSN